ncbi:extracellular solute-binding protein [Paenibacillus cymbidii]|uniref:extracellular solute-binding protein n=1 Tax=Paenibacillus cymbidii TaxID=1639034 RepID=UPI001436B0F7|nr:extracellular solute-binding protein [Paenibacillus cymbidii]
MKTKRLAAVGLSLALVLTTAVACSKSGSSGSSAPSASPQSTASGATPAGGKSAEPVTLKVMIAKDTVTGPLEKMKVFTELEKEFNVKFQFIPVEREVAKEKVNLAFSASDLPDYIIGSLLSKQDILRFSQSGQIVPLGELVDKYAPNVKRVNQQYPKMLSSQTAPDGNIYTLPFVDNGRHNQVRSRMFINRQWLTELKLDMPKTLDDFYKVLQAFKTEKKAIPLSGLPGNGMYNVGTIVLTGLGFPVVNDLNNLGNFFFTDADKVKFVMTDPRYKEYLTYMNKLQKEGLLDPEYFTQTDAQHKAKGNALKYGVFGYSAAHTMLTDPAQQLQYAVLLPLTSPSNPAPIWPVTDNSNNIAFAMTKANKNKELTMRIIDKGYEEDFAFAIRHPEPIYKDGILQPDKLPEAFAGNNFGWVNAEIAPIAAPYPYYYQTDKELKATAPKTGAQKVFLDGLYNLFDNYGRVAYPDIFFSEDDLKLINLTSNDILTYVKEMEAKFILGSEPLANYDKFVDKIRSLGLDKLLAVYQKTYDNYKATAKK